MRPSTLVYDAQKSTKCGVSNSFLRSLILSTGLFFSGAGASMADITDGVFGVAQIFDVQYNWSGDTLNASSFIAPFDSNKGKVVFGAGQYMAFFNTTQQTIADENLNTSKTWYGIGLYNADGTLDRVTHAYGEVQAIGPDAVFYIGSGFYGNVITPTAGYSYGDGASFTNMNKNVLAQDLQTYSSFANTVLGAGQTFDPNAVPQTTDAAVSATVSATGSVLERVLEQINGSNFAQVNGLFVNVAETITSANGVPTTIDGSIKNIISGVTSVTQEVVAVAATASEITLPTIDLGDMATTALGAVNTGEITLGVNSAVDEASASTTRAISVAMTQIGGSADTGALVLNVASNASAINGSIGNTMLAVNGSIGNMGTTALGAVNTGAITSGVNAAVQGIVGMSGQASSGL
jgi:hypothetical protein